MISRLSIIECTIAIRSLINSHCLFFYLKTYGTFIKKGVHSITVLEKKKATSNKVSLYPFIICLTVEFYFFVLHISLRKRLTFPNGGFLQALGTAQSSSLASFVFTTMSLLPGPFSTSSKVFPKPCLGVDAQMFGIRTTALPWGRPTTGSWVTNLVPTTSALRLSMPAIGPRRRATSPWSWLLPARSSGCSAFWIFLPVSTTSTHCSWAWFYALSGLGSSSSSASVVAYDRRARWEYQRRRVRLFCIWLGRDSLVIVTVVSLVFLALKCVSDDKSVTLCVIWF